MHFNWAQKWNRWKYHNTCVISCTMIQNQYLFCCNFWFQVEYFSNGKCWRLNEDHPKKLWECVSHLNDNLIRKWIENSHVIHYVFGVKLDFVRDAVGLLTKPHLVHRYHGRSMICIVVVLGNPYHQNDNFGKRPHSQLPAVADLFRS